VPQSAFRWAIIPEDPEDKLPVGTVDISAVDVGKS